MVYTALFLDVWNMTKSYLTAVLFVIERNKNI